MVGGRRRLPQQPHHRAGNRQPHLRQPQAEGDAAVGVVVKEKPGLHQIKPAEVIAVMEVALGHRPKLRQSLLGQCRNKEPGGKGEGEEKAGEEEEQASRSAA